VDSVDMVDVEFSPYPDLSEVPSPISSIDDTNHQMIIDSINNLSIL